MGIFIYTAVSKAVTQEEWEPVYEESLKMAEKLNLADWKKINLRGVTFWCLTRSREEEKLTWDGKKKKGWTCTGDYDYRTCCESNGFNRYINYEPAADAPDPLYCIYKIDKDGNKSGYHDYFAEYGHGKTQGEPQHISLLAIACMMQSRLKNKVFVYGDISRGQIRSATDMANRILDDKIDLPEKCDAERFFERVQRMPIDAEERLQIYMDYYLGHKDSEFGAFLRSHFSSETLYKYWLEQFHGLDVESYGFERTYKQYVEEGFDLAELCRIAELKDKDGNDLCKEFIQMVMDSEIYLSQKDCSDPLELNTDEPGAYGIASLFAQFVFRGAGNPRVNCYIPLMDLRNILKQELGNRCDVDRIIDDYLEKPDSELSDADQLRELINSTADKVKENRSDYDIIDVEDLQFYASGNKIKPDVQKGIVSMHAFCKKLLAENEFAQISRSSLKDKIQFLAENSYRFDLRDSDWQIILENIENDSESFGRYWAAVRIDTNKRDIRFMVQAYMVNDDLYHDLRSGILEI